MRDWHGQRHRDTKLKARASFSRLHCWSASKK
jgi:hypothetical protein